MTYYYWDGCLDGDNYSEQQAEASDHDDTAPCLLYYMSRCLSLVLFMQMDPCCCRGDLTIADNHQNILIHPFLYRSDSNLKWYLSGS